MAYAGGRTFFDADSHLMELPGFLRDNADPDVRDRLPSINFAGGGKMQTALEELGARARDSPARVEELIGLGDRLISGPKGYQALGAFNGSERARRSTCSASNASWCSRRSPPARSSRRPRAANCGRRGTAPQPRHGRLLCERSPAHRCRRHHTRRRRHGHRRVRLLTSTWTRRRVDPAPPGGRRSPATTTSTRSGRGWPRPGSLRCCTSARPPAVRPGLDEQRPPIPTIGWAAARTCAART